MLLSKPLPHNSWQRTHQTPFPSSCCIGQAINTPMLLRFLQLIHSAHSSCAPGLCSSQRRCSTTSHRGSQLLLCLRTVNTRHMPLSGASFKQGRLTMQVACDKQVAMACNFISSFSEARSVQHDVTLAVSASSSRLVSALTAVSCVSGCSCDSRRSREGVSWAVGSSLRHFMLPLKLWMHAHAAAHTCSALPVKTCPMHNACALCAALIWPSQGVIA